MEFYEQVRIIIEGVRFPEVDGYKPIPLNQKEEECVTLISQFLQKYYFKLAKQPFNRPGGIATDEAIYYPDEDYIIKNIYKFLCNLIDHKPRRDDDWDYVGGIFLELDKEPSVKALIDRLFDKKKANTIWKKSEYSVSITMMIGGLNGWGRENFKGVYKDLDKIKEIIRTGMYAFIGSIAQYDRDGWVEVMNQNSFYKSIKNYRIIRTMKPETQKHFGDILTGINNL